MLQLLVSAEHRLAGRPADGPAPGPADERVRRVEVRAGLGLVGDRYYGRPAHRDAAVTLMSAENLPADIDPAADLRHTRRNILLRGVDVDAHVGATIALDCGHGPVRLAVNRPARPCAWMDVTVGPGAQRALRGGGGVRCTPLDDGVLEVGRPRSGSYGSLTCARARPALPVVRRKAGRGRPGCQIRPPVSRVRGPCACRPARRPTAYEAAVSAVRPAPTPAATSLRSAISVQAVLAPAATWPEVATTAWRPASTPLAAACAAPPAASAARCAPFFAAEAVSPAAFFAALDAGAVALSAARPALVAAVRAPSVFCCVLLFASVMDIALPGTGVPNPGRAQWAGAHTGRSASGASPPGAGRAGTARPGSSSRARYAGDCRATSQYASSNAG